MTISIKAAAGRLLAFFHDMPRLQDGTLQHMPDPSHYANMGIESQDQVDQALHELHEGGQIRITKTTAATKADTDSGETAPHKFETTDSVKLLDLRPVPRLSTETNEAGAVERPQTDPTDLHPNHRTITNNLGTPEETAAKEVLRAADTEGVETAEPGQGQDTVDSERVKVPENVEPKGKVEEKPVEAKMPPADPETVVPRTVEPVLPMVEPTPEVIDAPNASVFESSEAKTKRIKG